MGRVFAGSAMTLLQAAIAWQVAELAKSGQAALQLGLLGLMRFIPQLLISLPAGALADRFDRRRIVLFAQVVPMSLALVLFLTTRNGSVSTLLIYGVVMLIAVENAFEWPARQALLPMVVPREVFPNAVTVASTVQQAAFVLGPIAAGIVIATKGTEAAYLLYVVLAACAFVSTLLLRPRKEAGERRAVSFASMIEGVQFVWQRQVLLGSMALDMFAVIFAGAQAMLPIYAKDILQVGPTGYGWLQASLGIGALGMSIIMVFMPPVQRTGRALLFAVAGFGLATIGFGLSRNFALSLAFYGLCGVFDQISVIMRQTTIQLSTPDELRGRVSAVSSLFIGASNQLGSVESGLVAAATNATFAVVSGGLGCIAVVGWIAARMPLLRSFDIAQAGAAAARPAATPEPATRISRPAAARRLGKN